MGTLRYNSNVTRSRRNMNDTNEILETANALSTTYRKPLTITSSEFST